MWVDIPYMDDMGIMIQPNDILMKLDVGGAVNGRDWVLKKAQSNLKNCRIFRCRRLDFSTMNARFLGKTDRINMKWVCLKN